jgi:hypothetical protein
VRAELDANKYPKGVKVSDAQLAAVNLTRHPFHGDCYAQIRILCRSLPRWRKTMIASRRAWT